jgi:hypothetical protein
MLSINDALRVYYLLEPYLPEKAPNDLLAFMGTLVSNLKENAPEAYVDALGLMLDKSREQVLEEIPPDESVVHFSSGLEANSLLSLREFVRKLEDG